MDGILSYIDCNQSVRAVYSVIGINGNGAVEASFCAHGAIAISHLMTQQC